MAPLQPTVRRARPADAAAFARVMGNPDVFPSLMQLPLASEEHWRTRIADMTAPGREELLIVAELDGQVVGSAGLHPATQIRRRHAAMLGISIEPQAWGQGVGTMLMQTLCDYADGWAQLLRLELTVFADNARAIALYERFGFRIEGTLRGFAMRNGAYADALTMARLHPKQPLMGWPA